MNDKPETTDVPEEVDPETAWRSRPLARRDPGASVPVNPEDAKRIKKLADESAMSPQELTRQLSKLADSLSEFGESSQETDS